MVSEDWGATARSNVPEPQPRTRFLGHYPGYSQAKQRANQAAQQSRSASPAARALSFSPSSLAPNSSPGLVFDGPSETDTSFIPPDPVIAAGPSHVVVAINSLLAIYDKSGHQVGGFQDLEAFFASLGLNGEIFDPRLIYDQADGRFILSVAEVDMTGFSNGHVLVAVSQTSDPTGGWYKYAIDFKGISPYTGQPTFPDFPGLGLGPAALYLTSNQFEMNKACMSGEPNDVCPFTGAWIKVIALPQLLAGNSALTVTTFKDVTSASGQLAFSIQPALTYGSPAFEFLVAASFSADPSDKLDLFAINSSGTPSLYYAELSVPPFHMPADAQQGGTSTLIMTNDFRTLNAVWTNNSLWVGQNVGPYSAAARWYQIQLTSLATATLLQSQQDIGVGEAYFPAISVKPDGTVIMAYTTSNQILPASAAFTGRAPSDPYGMRGFNIYRQGATSYVEATDNRWGDYSGISLDPDGNSVWTIVEYAGSPNPHFRTAVAQMSAPPSLSVSPAGVSFDPTKVGQTSSPRTVTFQNLGSGSISLGNISKVGGWAADFTITSDLCSGTSLSAGQSCTVTLTFSPVNQTYELAYLGLNGGGGTAYATLSGFGLPPDVLSLTPSSVAFPPTVQQTASAPQVLTLTNVSGMPVQFYSIGLGSPFAQTNDCGSMLAIGASCHVTLVFQPTSAKTFNDFVNIRTSAQTFMVPVSGSGLAASAAVFCPPSLDFGNQVSATSSSPQTVVLTNTGAVQLTVTGIVPAGDFSETDDCVGSVPPRTSCAIHVTFTPSALGPRSGSFTVSDDAKDSPQTISLTGTGVTAGAELQLPAPAAASPERSDATLTAEARRRVAQAERPISFEPNQGQFPHQVEYVAHLPGYTLALTSGQLRFRFSGASDASARRENAETAITLDGANPRAVPAGLEQAPGKANYFLGNNPRQWRTNVPTYSRVKLQQVYPGVDLVYYGAGRQLEYDFVVRPHADPANIRLRFDPSATLSVSPAGDLLVATAAGTLRLHKPVVYQYAADGGHSPASRLYREGRWVVRASGAAAFKLGRYDRDRDLVIDPVLSFSTYLGGSGGDVANAVAVDPAGNVYVAGNTSSLDFPTTSNAIDKLCGTEVQCMQGNPVGFVAKLTSDGSMLLYSTYLGEAGPGTNINGIAVDSAGNPYVTGATHSNDFPTTPNSFQPGCPSSPCYSAFVTKFDPAGSSLIYSTYLGASTTFGDIANAIAVDSQGKAHVVGTSSSATFPVTPGAYQALPPGPVGSRGFVSLLNASGSALIFSTYFNGSSEDTINAVAVDAAGATYVTGHALSLDFPTTPGAFQTGSFGGDALIAKFSPSGSLLYSTLLGGEADFFGPGTNSGNGIAVDASGAAYVSGNNNIGGFPTTPGAFRTSIVGAGNTGFLAKLHPQGCALAYATYTNAQDARGVVLDAAGDAFVIGNTINYGPLPSTPQVPGVGALQPALGGATSVLSEFDPAGANLLFSTPFGGSYLDGANAIALSSTGDIYIAGSTHSLDMPNTGAFQPECPTCTANDGRAFVARIDPKQAATGVSLTRSHLNFAPWPANFAQPETEVVGLMNHQAVSLNIQAISVAGAGYAIGQNSCTGSVMPDGGCVVQVKFQPQDGGPLPGVLTIVDDGPGSPRQVLLNGTGSADYSFYLWLHEGAPLKGTDAVTYDVSVDGVAGAAWPGGTVQLSCSGAAPAVCSFNPPSVTINSGSVLTVSNLSAVSGDLLTFSVVGAMGTQTASSTQKISFTDFSLSVPQGPATVAAGSSVTYQINGTSNGIVNTVSFSCANLPSYASCAFNPPSLNMFSGFTSTTTLTVTTQAVTFGSSLSAPAPRAPVGRSRRAAVLTLAGLVGFVFLVGTRDRRSFTALLAVMLLMVFCLSCGGGGSSSSSGGGGSPQAVTHTTPPGTYTINVNAQTGGVLQHSIPITLVVK